MKISIDVNELIKIIDGEFNDEKVQKIVGKHVLSVASAESPELNDLLETKEVQGTSDESSRLGRCCRGRV